MKKFTKREWEIMILSILTTSAVISTIFTKINEKKEQKRMDYKVIRDMTTEVILTLWIVSTMARRKHYILRMVV